MDLTQLKKLLSESTEEDRIFIAKAREAERYFKGNNDILDPIKMPKPWLIMSENQAGNPMRSADNRIACTYYNFLVNQKAVYLVGNPPSYDSGSKQVNDDITEFLGNHWAKTCKTLSINASNCGVAWLHSWLDQDSGFHYGVVDSKQIKPLWGGTIDQELLAVVREYSYRDPMTGEAYDVVEFWDKEKCYSYKKESKGNYVSYSENCIYTRFNYDLQVEEPTNEYVHGFSQVPFSAFYNNQFHYNDLHNIKGYIDIYDKVFSFFADNLEDVQQIILVLENMGGVNLSEFKSQLKREKAIKVINEENRKTDLRTLTIEIPTNAAETLLTLARKNIFEQGQGVDPLPENYSGNTSGEALRYMYANLDLKCGAMKDEFETGFRHFLKLMSEHSPFQIDVEKVKFIWGEPTRINNIQEAISNVTSSQSLLSERTLLAHHPFVEDVDEEIKQKEKETNPYGDAQNLNIAQENTSEDEESGDEAEKTDEE